jgi:hypothetical protein
MIRGRLRKGLKAQAPEDVEAYRIAVWQSLQKAQHLLPGIRKIAPGKVRGVDEKDGCVAFGSRGTRLGGRFNGRAVAVDRPTGIAVGLLSRRRWRGGRLCCLAEEVDFLLAAIVINLKVFRFEVCDGARRVKPVWPAGGWTLEGTSGTAAASVTVIS